MKNLLRSTLICMIFLLAAHSLQAQKLDHVLGHVLVQAKKEADIRQIVSDLQSYRGQSTQLEMVDKVSDPMQVWELKFDQNTINENYFLHQLQNHPLVSVAQFNHVTQLRSTTPNDPGFNQQWQYINTGSNGGVVGADIDIDLAWDFTTGGITPDGDTIVVCIIDEGFDIQHSDLVENIWHNHLEIPNNGIDDDNNGYVDDYGGWSTANNNDNVSEGGWHGTAVAGIVGAKGNNNNGVAGVNWDVKLMLIEGGTGVESEVLRAYSFPLTHRIRYNETNGAEGAFVVSTNASWGVDFGNPANAPLWCAFYDTLGVHGIVSCGATINGNQNVDIIGDLPTACPSDYLISVTNMNRSDIKVTNAGYGAETIDLGAFGADTYTADNNNTYGGFGGTSGATPHVAGTVALLYAYDCGSLISLAKTNPGEAALKIKGFILDGVDPNASLQGITTTGGRLNVFNSMVLLSLDCSPCPRAFSVDIDEIIDTSAVLSWQVTDSIVNSTIRWRVDGTMDWDTLENVSSPYVLSGLVGCTDYEFQIQGFCSDTLSGFTDSYFFSSEGCCNAPEGIQEIEVDLETASFNWGSVFAAQSYRLQYRELGSTDWITEAVNANSYEFENLAACSSYEFQVETICDVDSTSGYSPITTFNTLCPCDAPEVISLDTIGLDFAEISWDAGTFADQYTLRYKELGTVNWEIISSPIPAINLEDLLECTSYQFQVRADCPTVQGTFSGSQIFKTACITVSVEDQLAGIERLEVYPNPFNQLIEVDISLAEAEQVDIQLINYTGHEIITRSFKKTAGVHHLQLALEGDIPPGVYLLQVHTEKGTMIKRLIRQ
ncbi:MAG: S8 family serine peptidase [Bacteroidota bacterium]